ncbi:hypothetical protein F0562_005207 [Nyssa sinensis]|uniref:Uncharacterized protein n=1 Tax=Nyssa sinensis TaxID=561372 RepID=A0A5J5AJV8_9ASTE|nr:hypothetical protein F0562_005207 [Nyssa sinensis]
MTSFIDEENAGVARYVGLSSPAMMTAIFGLVSSSVIIGISGSFLVSLDELGNRFRDEQARMTNATVMSTKTRAKLPKR